MSLESVTVSALTALGLEYADAVVIQRALADFEQYTTAAQVQADPLRSLRSVSTARPDELMHVLQCPVGMEKHHPQHSQCQASFCCAQIPVQGCLWSVVAPREGTLMQTLQFFVNNQCDVLDCPGSCTSVGTRGPGNCRHELGQIHGRLSGTETELISCMHQGAWTNVMTCDA